MKYTKLLFCLTLLIISSSVNAQDASKIMDAITSSIKKHKSIKSSYTIIYNEGGKTNSHNGAIILQGNKYVNKINGTMTWFNGKTMWAYVEDNEEVTVTNPTADEIASSNPYSFLNTSKQEFNASLLSSNSSQYTIKLTPKTKKEDINNIILNVKKASYQPIDMTIDMKKSKMTIRLNNFETNQAYKTSSFTFNKNKYPNVEIVDLR